MIGLIPLLAFILPLIRDLEDSIKFVISGSLTFLSFIVIGFFKSKVSGKSIKNGILETTLLGSAAATLAFLAGSFLEAIIAK